MPVTPKGWCLVTKCLMLANPDAHTYINFAPGIILGVLVVAAMATVIAGMMSGRAQPLPRLNDEDSIQVAIDRYDRRQRNNWYWHFWD